MAMEELIGKTITKLFIGQGNENLKFECLDGDVLYYAAFGDCCSYSWFEHVTTCNLLNSKVLCVNYTGGSEKEISEEDYLKISNYRIDTIKGSSTFELRNSSNGYYSGYIEKCDVLEGSIVWKELTEDI